MIRRHYECNARTLHARPVSDLPRRIDTPPLDGPGVEPEHVTGAWIVTACIVAAVAMVIVKLITG